MTRDVEADIRRLADADDIGVAAQALLVECKAMAPEREADRYVEDVFDKARARRTRRVYRRGGNMGSLKQQHDAQREHFGNPITSARKIYDRIYRSERHAGHDQADSHDEAIAEVRRQVGDEAADSLEHLARVGRKRARNLGGRGNHVTLSSQAVRELYDLSLDGGPDEEVGSSSDGVGWAGLMRGPFEEGEGVSRAVAKELDGAAGVIIFEDSQGFHGGYGYESDEELDAAWAETQEDLGGEPPEDEEENPNEPMEDDLTTEDHIHFYQSGKLVLTAEDDDGDPLGDKEMWAAIEAHMEKTGFYPNVWFVSDHGNFHLMTK